MEQKIVVPWAGDIGGHCARCGESNGRGQGVVLGSDKPPLSTRMTGTPTISLQPMVEGFFAIRLTLLGQSSEIGACGRKLLI